MSTATFSINETLKINNINSTMVFAKNNYLNNYSKFLYKIKFNL